MLLKRGANVNDVAPDGSSALEHGRRSTPTSSWRRCCSITAPNPNLPDPRGSPLHTVAWLRKPGADGAAGVGNTPQGTPQQTGNVTALQLAKKLLEKGANPNARVEWKEPTLRQGRRHGAQPAEHRALAVIFSATSARRRSTSPPRTATRR